MLPIIIVGAGLAGYTLAREVRKLDKTVPLIIVTADDGAFYSKPMLSNAFAQKKEAAQLASQSAAQMGAQLNATILTGIRAESIDTRAGVLNTAAGPFEYGSLVLAVGARPIRLDLQGDAAHEVLAVNHLDDYAHFRARLASQKAGRPATVAILGAGLIGCEFADDLAGAGHEVTLIDPNPAPLAALAAPALSQGLAAALAGRGIGLRLGTTAARIDRRGETLQLTLADGSTLAADIVLSAVGLRPDLVLAQSAGIATARGILVDAFGRAGAPTVYALGDCAEYTFGDGETRTLPYIAPLMSAARAIGRTLTGTPTAIELKPAPVIVKTPSYPLALLPPPPQATAAGYWLAETLGERLLCRFYDQAHALAGFGLSHHEAGARSALLAELGSIRQEAA